MKKLLVILSIIFIEACSDGDIGGYTESIIKGAKASEAYSAHAQDKPATLNKYVSPLDEDLSGLDEEELREKLMNSYPRPKAEGNPEPESSSSDRILVNEYDMPLNPYDGEVKPFKWKESTPYFTEAPNYKYGFDQDPTGKDPYVYISVKEDDNVSIQLHFTKDAYDGFCLVHQNEDKSYDYAKILTNSKTHIIYSEELKKMKEFKLIGAKGHHAMLCPKLKEPIKTVSILPYKMITKHIKYIEFNGEKCTTSSTTPEQSTICENHDNETYYQTNCKDKFTKCCTEHYFNKIFGQAVVNVDIQNTSECKYIKHLSQKSTSYISENGLLNLYMTTPSKISLLYKELIYVAKLENEQTGIKTITEEGPNKGKKEISFDEPSWHTVFAINKVRKKWELWKCAHYAQKHKSTDFLNYCPGLNPEKDPPNTKYFFQLGSQKAVSAEIVLAKYWENGQYTYGYKLYVDKDEKLINFDDIKDKNKEAYLYTEDANPSIFLSNAVQIEDNPKLWFTTEALSHPLYGEKNEMYEQYLPYGSIIFSPRRNGIETYYLLMHELGHSFGLTDVVLTDIYEIKEEPLSSSSSTTSSNSSTRTYPNRYGSYETNLMAWLDPSGKKLRYRPIPVVCTAGQHVYTQKRTENEKNYVDGNMYGYIELPIKYSDDAKKYDKDKEHLGYEKNQWECIRNCFIDNEFSTPERRIYWYEEGTTPRPNPTTFTDIDYCNGNIKELRSYGGKNIYMSENEFKTDTSEYWNRVILNRSSSSSTSN
ncbi:hypothetical protein [Fibrobacter sp. UBA4297]|uniref:hypothetical protein n=1 Tax=Fibrobacter sp. UBA4297 TaxID=1946536 RepID=UPI0025BDACA9|nr:hypothetical protein [Fibrobacter sp. UBA4297]